MQPIGGSVSYGERPCRSQVRKGGLRPSERVVWFSRFIPVYPDEITVTELVRKSGIREGELPGLITGVESHYLLCQDENRFSLLRRGIAHVD